MLAMLHSIKASQITWVSIGYRTGIKIEANRQRHTVMHGLLENTSVIFRRVLPQLNMH